MKHKTSELSGALLDVAVAKAEGTTNVRIEDWGQGDLCVTALNAFEPVPFRPSSNWSNGGPIIDRERISLIAPMLGRHMELWTAGTGAVQTYDGLELDHEQEGDTGLIAAMRCFVASKLGEEVEL